MTLPITFTFKTFPWVGPFKNKDQQILLPEYLLCFAYLSSLPIRQMCH